MNKFDSEKIKSVKKFCFICDCRTKQTPTEDKGFVCGECGSIVKKGF